MRIQGTLRFMYYGDYCYCNDYYCHYCYVALSVIVLLIAILLSTFTITVIPFVTVTVIVLVMTLLSHITFAIILLHSSSSLSSLTSS